MFYSLAAAATATGLTRTTILKAIKDGKIFAIKDALGEWSVEPAELHRVFAPVAVHGGGGDPAQRLPGSDLEALTSQIEALLRQAGDRLRRQMHDVRRERDVGDRPTQVTQLQLADQEHRLR